MWVCFSVIKINIIFKDRNTGAIFQLDKIYVFLKILTNVLGIFFRQFPYEDIDGKLTEQNPEINIFNE